MTPTAAVAAPDSYQVYHRRPCATKRYWPSECVARNWRFLLALRYPDAARLEVYPCDECQGWHLGPPPVTIVVPSSGGSRTGRR